VRWSIPKRGKFGTSSPALSSTGALSFHHGLPAASASNCSPVVRSKRGPAWPYIRKVIDGIRRPPIEAFARVVGGVCEKPWSKPLIGSTRRLR
jgi:hypothetical protein